MGGGRSVGFSGDRKRWKVLLLYHGAGRRTFIAVTVAVKVDGFADFDVPADDFEDGGDFRLPSRYALTVFSLFYNGILTEKDLSEFDDRTREDVYKRQALCEFIIRTSHLCSANPLQSDYGTTR